MSTLTVPAAHVSDHPAGQIVLRDVNVAANRASALAGYRTDWLLGGLTTITIRPIDDFVCAEAN